MAAPSSNGAWRLSPPTTTCTFEVYLCTKPCADGFQLCVDHILEDRDAPYRPCTFIYPNGKRCTNNVLRGERRDGICADHAKRAAAYKMKSLRKRQPQESLNTLLGDLQHYNSTEAQADPLNVVEQHQLSQSSQRILDYASDTDSEAETVTLEQTQYHEDDSDAESVDSDEEPLRHAGVYTAEEVVLLTRDRLLKLQSLYVEQFKRLHCRLKESRRKYLNGIKKEKEAGVLQAPYPDSPAEHRAAAKLKALRRYQRPRGVEALLYHQLQEKRFQATQGIHYKAPPFAKCSFVDGGVKCTNPVLPLAKNCIKHILSDSGQFLFRPCGAPVNDGECKEPVFNMSDTARCVFHTEVPPPVSLDKTSANEAELDTGEVQTNESKPEQDVQDPVPAELVIS